MTITSLKDIRKEEINLFGGKATNLGFLLQHGFNVPQGFCISTEIRELTKGLKEEVSNKFKDIKHSVAVRSSATVEDSKVRSFAGQFETFLDIGSEKELFMAIEKCRNSLRTEKIKAYLKHKNSRSAKMAVIVQKMIKPDFSGVVFTLDPLEKKHILIEIVKGSGEKLVGGEVTPNAYYVNRKDLSVEKNQTTFTFDEELLHDISETALKIEHLYDSPQDIEFCLKNGSVEFLRRRKPTL